ncbi:protein kinase domain-containing protein [Pseudopedobacter beijingensis]|uniref:Protein kinase n=1 Tax=Pseudopedobacter beijingensis TaxID=1207056 RepID=A0ABW4I9K7_9SPHI
MTLSNLTETHLLITWHNATTLLDDIKKQISDNFTIKRIFCNSWDNKDFLGNLVQFYAHSQKEKSSDDYLKILKNKIAHCGNGKFYVFVIEDHTPHYDYRLTSNGEQIVNTNIFDLKTNLRELTGGGHKIHCSNNIFESNKDLTLIFHKNKDDFYKEHQGNDQNIIKIKQNCLGFNGFNQIEDLFYLLNNTIQYCVLRNFECLPNEYTLEGHGDIDLLVENLNYIVYLTNAKPVFPDKNYRVHYTIKIDKEDIPFDFRYLGDGYYDVNWQNEILNTSIFFNNCIKTPNEINHFYSLLYHAYVQKHTVKEDYKIRLKKIAENASLKYGNDQTENENILHHFMVKQGYEYTIPLDETVHFKKIIEKNYREEPYKLISRNIVRYGKKVYFSEVFRYDERTILKKGSPYIIKNEFEYLSLLKDYKYFPKIYEYSNKNEIHSIKISYIHGEKLIKKIITDSSFWTAKNIQKIHSQILDILSILTLHNIIHRDFTPNNLLIDADFNIYLIDFGWATSSSSDTGENITPNALAQNYRKSINNFNDWYFYSRIAGKLFFRITAFKRVSDFLSKADQKDYLNHSDLQKLYDLNKMQTLQFTLKDYFIITSKRCKLFYNKLIKKLN